MKINLNRQIHFKCNKIINEFTIILVVTLGLTFVTISDTSAVEYYIPAWIQTTATWWGEDKISDVEFVNSLQFLLDKKILEIPKPETLEPVCGPGTVLDEVSEECIIPDETEETGIFPESFTSHQSIVTSWIKVTTMWWGQDKISDQDFVNALQFLVENNVLIIEPEIQLSPKPQQEPIPSFKNLLPKIDRIDEFKIQGHGRADTYYLRFNLIDQSQREVATDGTVSVVILDNSNRILYLDTFSIKKSDFTKSYEAFSNKDTLEYSWEIPNSEINTGFGSYGTAKIVFSDRGGNIFSKEIDSVSIPNFS